jgi:ubiquinone/menaquinone biosynthesis C-methylase UbiE
MNQAQQFNIDLHEADKQYSAGSYNMVSLMGQQVIREWAKACSNRPVKLLDVGCGKGVFLRDFCNELRSRHAISDIQATGVDLLPSPGNHFSEIGSDFQFVAINLDGQTLPFPDRSFDFVSCNHVLEHIFDTEKLVSELQRVLKPQGLCVISVPNLAAWVNRVFLLFAGQPLGTELGIKKTSYGFWPAFLQPRLDAFQPSGHIRDFTPRGLRDLAHHCGLETVGWWKQGKDPLARLGKWAGRAVAIIGKPKI